MNLKTVFLGALAALCAYGFAEPFSPVYDDLNAENQFITVFCHGFDNKESGKNPNFYGLTGGYFSDSVEVGAADENQRNCMFYNFSNMGDHGSDDLIREIGDFETGSKLLDRDPRCFISLAKCEWVYRNCITLRNCFKDDYWWLNETTQDPPVKFDGINYSKQQLMADLLRNGPRFTDFYIANPAASGVDKDRYKYIVTLLKSGLPSEKTKAFGVTITDEDFTAIAKECYQLATGDYVDDAFRNDIRIRGRKCPATIRFVTHSMGGMMVSKYVSESADLYADGHAHGFYQRYLEYSDDELTEDLSNPTGTLALKIAAQNAALNALFPGEAASSPAANLRLRKAYRDERQNSVDKIIMEDCPIAGTPLASGKPRGSDPKGYSPMIRGYEG